MVTVVAGACCDDRAGLGGALEAAAGACACAPAKALHRAQNAVIAKILRMFLMHPAVYQAGNGTVVDDFPAEFPAPNRTSAAAFCGTLPIYKRCNTESRNGKPVPSRVFGATLAPRGPSA